MDVEHKPVDEEDKKCEVTDEVANRQLDSEENGTDEGEIMLPKTLSDIQPFVSTEEPGTRDKNSECTQNTGEDGHITNPPPHDQPPLEQVDDVNNLSEVNGSLPKMTDLLEVRNVPDKSNEKGTDGLQNSGDKTEVENMDVTFLQRVNHPESAPPNNKKGDESTICTETKQVKESEKKIESIEDRSAKRSVEASTATLIEWDLNVLIVSGLPPARSGDLKQLLKTTLGVNSHRIEPRHRGDSVIRVHFRSKDDMAVARDLLHKQMFQGYRLTAVVQNMQAQKRKAEKIDEVKKPPAKKKKWDTPQLKAMQAVYFNQIAKKNENVYLKLQHVAKRLGDSYPIYDGLMRRRELENGGFICALNKFKVCPPNKRFSNRCKFSIGTDAVTGQLIVGLRGANGAVNQVTSVPHNFPPHVVEAAKVFEKVVHTCEQALEDPEGGCQYQFWHELIIHTNVAHDLMMLVYVKCPEELAADRMTRLNKELKELFENGEGQKCRVTSLYTRVTYTTTRIPEQRTLVMGSPYLEESIMGLKLQLLPTVRFWSNISAARNVCRGVEQMMPLTKKISLVEVGFGLGLVGMHLSRFAGEVLSVVAHQNIAEAQKNAACNNIKNIQYFGGSPVEALPQIAEKIAYDKACAVMISSAIRSSAGAATMEVLRKMNKVRRLVLVTEMSKACFKSIAALCNPSQKDGLGNPFFPVRAIPVDTMPNEEGYVLMILMERIGLLSLPKSPGLPKGDSVVHSTEWGPDTRRAAGRLMPLAKQAQGKGDGYMTVDFQQVTREFKQMQREERLRSLKSFGGSGLKVMASYKQHLVEGELPYSSDQMSRVEEEYHLIQLRDQEWRRQIEEEHARWIGGEKQRRWVETGQQRRQVDKEEHRKWIQEKESRRYMGERELKRDIDTREFNREMEEIEFQKWVERGGERDLVGMNPNMGSRTTLVQEVIADSLRETEISHLSAEASQKLKQLVAEAVRTIGVMDRGERCGVSTSSGVGRIIPEDIADTRFGRSDKAMPQSRYFEDGHIREVDNPYDHRYDPFGGAVERSESKKMPQSRHFDEGYSRSVMEVDGQYQHGYSVYEGAVRNDSYQHDPKPQQSIYSAREVPFLRTGVDRAGSQPLRLREPSGGSSNDVSHLEGGDLHMRRVHLSDFSTSGNREEKFGQLPDSYTSYGNFAAHRTRNEHQPSHMRQSLHSAVEQNADSPVQLRAQNWDSSTVSTDYVPLSSPMKQLGCNMLKPPSTGDIHHPDRSNYMYAESTPKFNRFGAMLHHS